MDAKYVKNKTTISYINFNITFATRCNRKIFKNSKTKEIFETECRKVCNNLGVKVLEISMFDYYVNIVVTSPPEYSANEIIHKIKSHTSKVIRDEILELKKLPSLWTRKYLVTTEQNLSEEILKNFINKL